MKLTPDTKLAGVLAPLFALRGKNDLGVGDVAALRDLVDWCDRVGFRMIQILPINETGEDNSPYNAVSSAALDPTTLQTDPEGIKELDPEIYGDVMSRYPVQDMRAGSVDYRQVKSLKRELLERAFTVFEGKVKRGSARARKFKGFCEQHAGWLPDYTLFRALMVRHGNEQWDKWPKGQQTAKDARAWLCRQRSEIQEAFERSMTFYAYVQWIAYSQWGELKKYCDRKSVALMGDIPIGVSYYSSDVFSRPDVFDLKWSCGAPPERIFKSDPFTEKWGQNWGVPLYRWEALREKDYDWWRQRVQLVREVFHLFRIDHVLGFYRIYSFPWRPQQNEDFLPLSPDEARGRTGGDLPHFIPNDDESWENREDNRRHGEGLLRMVLDVVGPNCLVGEDLGVVPDYVRPSLASPGIAGFKVPMWEHAADGSLVPGRSYDRLSIATYATHDHPPMKTFWDEWVDAITRADLGEDGAQDQAGHARHSLQVLTAFAGIDCPASPRPYDDSVREGLLKGLLACNSWMAVPMITDVFGDDRRFNVPGAVADSNWSNRLDLCVADWAGDPGLAAKAAAMTKLITATGRRG